MDVLFEQRVVQNSALAAEALWQAAHEAYEVTDRTAGVMLPLIFLVLPITFHRQTATFLASKTQPGAIYKAIAEDREITVGLQTRMEAMAGKTFDGLAMALHSGLLRLDVGDRFQVFPGKKTPPVTHVTNEVKIVLSAAKRVGQAFAEMSVVQLATHLRVQF